MKKFFVLFLIVLLAIVLLLFSPLLLEKKSQEKREEKIGTEKAEEMANSVAKKLTAPQFPMAPAPSEPVPMMAPPPIMPVPETPSSESMPMMGAPAPSEEMPTAPRPPAHYKPIPMSPRAHTHSKPMPTPMPIAPRAPVPTEPMPMAPMSTAPTETNPKFYEEVSPKEPESDPQEALLKYVLLSVVYEPTMAEGETRSLQLRMSPRDLQRNIEQLLSQQGVKEGDIKNFIENVQDRFKYVSASLAAKDGCLQIVKRIPFEDRVYLPSVLESRESQIWQWDLTAPTEATGEICNLLLYIRFCESETICIPTQNPDKEIQITIKINFANRVIQWIKESEEVVSALAAIVAFCASVVGWSWWRKKKKKRKSEE